MPCYAIPPNTLSIPWRFWTNSLYTYLQTFLLQLYTFFLPVSYWLPLPMCAACHSTAFWLLGAAFSIQSGMRLLLPSLYLLSTDNMRTKQRWLAACCQAVPATYCCCIFTNNLLFSLCCCCCCSSGPAGRGLLHGCLSISPVATCAYTTIYSLSQAKSSWFPGHCGVLLPAFRDYHRHCGGTSPSPNSMKTGHFLYL